MDVQGAKESLEDSVRVLNGLQVPDAEVQHKSRALLAANKNRDTLIQIQKYLRLVFTKSPEVAEK